MRSSTEQPACPASRADRGGRTRLTWTVALAALALISNTDLLLLLLFRLARRGGRLVHAARPLSVRMGGNPYR